MVALKKRRLKNTLDGFYDEYDFDTRLLLDPIEFPHRYADPADIEVCGFIASCLAYGRVDLFKPVAEKILSVMGKSPSSFLTDFSVKKQRFLFPWKYRFNESSDIVCLLFIIHTLLVRYGSLRHAFMRHFTTADQNTGVMLAGFVQEVMSITTTPVYGENIYPPGMAQFFPSPRKGSACKRMNLFLRWMVRDRDIDFGIWDTIPKNRLVIPLDTHIARIGKCLGLTKRKASDWKTAVEITESLKAFDPEDPLRYDFALCHHGISGICTSRGHSGCGACLFSSSS
jgi:uncharacterized protein (TIGR02757 family)